MYICLSYVNKYKLHVNKYICYESIRYNCKKKSFSDIDWSVFPYINLRILILKWKIIQVINNHLIREHMYNKCDIILKLFFFCVFHQFTFVNQNLLQDVLNERMCIRITLYILPYFHVTYVSNLCFTLSLCYPISEWLN